MFASTPRALFLTLSFTVLHGFSTMSSSFAAIEPRNILKAYFETGDVPTEQQFSNLIDSMLNQIDDGIGYTGSIPDASGKGALLGAGTEVGPGSFTTPVAGLGEDWVGRSGFLGISLELNSRTHYGYLQISSPPGDQYPMFVEYAVIETSPNTAITVATIPEPSSLALLLLTLSSALLRVRR